MKVSEQKLRKIIREVVEEEIPQILSSSGTVKKVGVPNSFYVVFRASSENSTLRDVVSEVDYLTLWRIGRGTANVESQPVGVYGLDHKQEAIEHGKREVQKAKEVGR